MESAGEGRSRARVTYRMTSLSPAGDDFVRTFADGYDAFLSEWEEAIRRYVDTARPSRGAREATTQETAQPTP